MLGADDERYSGQIGIELLRIMAQILVLDVLLGLVSGYTLKLCLRCVRNDRVEVGMIIGYSYLNFWLGELIMGSSEVSSALRAHEGGGGLDRAISSRGVPRGG